MELALYEEGNNVNNFHQRDVLTDTFATPHSPLNMVRRGVAEREK